MSAATPFHTLLVANRGEIALRIMRSARTLGLRTVAVYSSADAQSRHVRQADMAVCIGEPAPSQSYLNIAALIEAARLSGADAVHPGYGFLAENPDFARACQAAGLVFVGPSPEAMLAMGDKAQAKRQMAAAGVPCIPGYQGQDQTAERLQAEAERLGWPLMIKACAGGGGRGMRRVDRMEDFAGALASAKNEALNAFGDASVLIERALLGPRHIEIQVVADRYGQAIHLGERDCSVQRRHQKIIEEAPSPAVSPALRERMGQVALQAVHALAYEGVGTLEFLLTQGVDGPEFFFMEMNTRLQVEHPVTEAITGLDLVALQLQVAAGQPLPLTQDQVRWQGHAVELRLCAEDPAQGFMPQSGRMLRWQPDALLRTDSALEDGCEVPPWYDSMVAKLIAHGPDRDSARRRLRLGLQDTVALGLPTNQSYLAACLDHPVWVAGGASTDFIEAHGEQLLAACQGDVGVQAALGALAVLELNRHQPASLAHRAADLPASMPIRLRLRCGAARVQISAQRREGHWLLGSEGTLASHTVSLQARDGDHWRLTLDGVQRSLHVARDVADPHTLWLQSLGQVWQLRDESLEPAQRVAIQGDGKVRAAMNGRVVALHVTVGQWVRSGEAVLTLEAMKMEHRHTADIAGLVRAVYVQAGDQVSAARLLVDIEPAELS